MKLFLKSFLIIIFILGFSSILVVGSNNQNIHPQELYRVYLDGKSIGLIKSEKKLKEYIDKEQKELKEKYHVNKVYPPTGLQIQKEITYDTNIISTIKAYEKIKEISNFTIEGYEISIKKESPLVFYVLKKEDFEKAVNKTIKSFINEEEYLNFENKNQAAIKDTGSIIEDIYIDQDIILKKKLISVEQTIYTSDEDISRFLLYGKEINENKYIVKEGDTIEKVAYNNGLNTNEFLIANPKFNDTNNLLFPGQEVEVNLISPQFDVIVERHTIERKAKDFKTEIIYDPSQSYGVQYVKQQGETGENRVTEKIRYVNGQITTVVVTNTEELKPAVNKIVIKGEKYIKSVGGGIWAWPTITPYVISTYYEYRWGTFHGAIDITGVGHGSPVYAANNGVVYKIGRGGAAGNAIYINHNNGYYTIYYHLSRIYANENKVVERGEVIGAVGNTGQSTGSHLHFGVYVGAPFEGGYHIDPFRLYR